MKDRIPTYPGRVKLTPVSGQTNTYDMVRADEPMQEGTPLNKNTLLRDATAAALGLTADATVDEAMERLKAITDDRAKIETGSYTGTNKRGASNPNSLSFSFAPKIVYIFAEGTYNTYKHSDGVILAHFCTTSYNTFMAGPIDKVSDGMYAKKSDDGKTVYWYTTDTSQYAVSIQYNAPVKYNYFAIG